MTNGIKREALHWKMNQLVNLIKEHQLSDGSFRFCFESGPLTDAYMIILLRALEDSDKVLIQRLAQRIASLQAENGSWKLFPDKRGGNLSATILAYYALLVSGMKSKDDQEMKLARHYIINEGGLHQAHLFTKISLSITGEYPWKNYFFIPIEFLLLPPSSINPDVDDTAAVLRALHQQEDRRAIQSWNRGIQWLLSMQNMDGGWPAFEKNTDKSILT